jgi:hypothetical protein
VARKRNTQEQEEFLTWLRWGKGCAVIDAKAGSGKTTTICNGYLDVDEARKSGSSIFIAFNKSVVEELRQKGMPSLTAHAIGFRAWRRANPTWTPGRGRLDLAADSDSSNEDSAGESHGQAVRTGTNTGGMMGKAKITTILAELFPPRQEERKSKHGLGSKLGRFVQ